MITKSDDPNQKIDAAVAAIVALERASVRDTGSVYDDRDMVVL
jgi:phage terminase large subunit-like protein